MTGWAIETALAVSILIGLVLLLRGPVAALFGARAAYALWLAPAARAVLPPISLPSVPIPTGAVGEGANYVFVAADSAGGASLVQLLAAAWAAGALLFLALHWWRHHRFLSEALASGRPLDVPGVPYDVVASARIDGPMATGLIHPLILVPTDFAQRFNPDQQRFALWHEQLHHRRGDIWASAAALLVASFLWFNPLAHLALGAFRRDMEAACDASLIAGAGRSSAPAYAETILRCAARPVPRSLCALTAIDELKGRLIMLNRTHGLVRRTAGIAIAGAVTLAGLTIATPAAADETKKFVKRIEMREVREGEDVTKLGGPGELRELAMKCPGEKFEVSSSGGGSGERKQDVKFVLCTDKGESLLPALEKAVANIEKDELELDSGKQEILSKLRAKIAELRAKG